VKRVYIRGAHGRNEIVRTPRERLTVSIGCHVIPKSSSTPFPCESYNRPPHPTPIKNPSPADSTHLSTSWPFTLHPFPLVPLELSPAHPQTNDSHLCLFTSAYAACLSWNNPRGFGHLSTSRMQHSRQLTCMHIREVVLLWQHNAYAKDKGAAQWMAYLSVSR
jgi:hypothetical protein